MTNDQFKVYLAERLARVTEKLSDGNTGSAERQSLSKQKDLLNDAIRISKYSSGQAFRNFRRNFERRMRRYSVAAPSMQ